jgi:nucleoside-diphosphate-sugar epimerase
VIIHCAWEGAVGAARTDPAQFGNLATTCALVDAAIAAGVERFVGIGTHAEYGRYDRRIREDDLPTPITLHGATKLATFHLARQRALAGGMGFAWTRMFSAYGPGDNAEWLIPSVTADLLAGRPPRLTAGTQAWDFLHIDDVARAILAIARERRASGLFNLSSGDAIPIREVVEMLRDLAAPQLDLTFGAVPYSPDQILHLEGDNGRLRYSTGWEPEIPLAQGLAKRSLPSRGVRRLLTAPPLRLRWKPKRPPWIGIVHRENEDGHFDDGHRGTDRARARRPASQRQRAWRAGIGIGRGGRCVARPCRRRDGGPAHDARTRPDHGPRRRSARLGSHDPGRPPPGVRLTFSDTGASAGA